MLTGYGPENASIVLLTDYETKESWSHNKVVCGSEFLYYKKLFNVHHYEIGGVFKSTFFRSELPNDWRRILMKGHLKYPYVSEPAFNSLCEAHLNDLIAELKCLTSVKFIIACGEIPLNILTGERKITKFQGSILPFSEKLRLQYPFLNDKYIIPILPYRSVVLQAQMECITSIFIEKAIRFSRDEQYVPFEKKYITDVCTSLEQFTSFTLRHRGAAYWTSDFETLHNYPTCISFCGDGKEALSVPLLGSPLIKLDVKVQLWDAVCQFFKYLCRNKIPLINQNFNYDATIGVKSCMEYLECYGGDTMLYSHVLYPEFPRDLGFLTSIYTDIPYFKDEGKEFDPSKHDFKRLYLYNASDALATHIIYSEQLKDAEDLGVKEFYEKREAPLLLLYHAIEQNGILVDDLVVSRLQTKYNELLNEKIAYVRSYYEGKEINFNSPKQISEFVYDYLACPPRYKYDFDSETGERSKNLATGEDELEEIAIREDNKTVHSLLYSIIAIRKIYKILSFLSTPRGTDGKVRTSYKIAGTKSGRTSGNQPLDFSIIWDEKKKIYVKEPIGYSFQTIPRRGETFPDGTTIGEDIREIFVPARNYIFIEGDKSQAEARVVSILSGDLNLLPLFDDKVIGIHRTTAGWIYNCDPREISKSSKKDQRYDMGKRARHAGNYGMTPPRLSLMAHIKLDMAEFILTKFHKAQPHIEDVFHRSIQEMIHANQSVLTTPQGRRREFFGRKDSSLYKEAYSYYPQAVVSDDLKFSAYNLWQATKEFAWILAEAHDSILATTHKTNLNYYVDTWKTEMEKPIDFRLGSLPQDIVYTIPTELKCSEDSWANMEDVK